MPNLIDVFVNWFPMLLLIAVWIFFIRRMQGGKGFYTKYQKDYLEQMNRQGELLERIAIALEKIEAK